MWLAWRCSAYGQSNIDDAILGLTWIDGLHRHGFAVVSLLSVMDIPYHRIRDQRLGASVAQAQAPTGLGKYLMRSPSGEYTTLPVALSDAGVHITWIRDPATAMMIVLGAVAYGLAGF